MSILLDKTFAYHHKSISYKGTPQCTLNIHKNCPKKRCTIENSQKTAIPAHPRSLCTLKYLINLLVVVLIYGSYENTTIVFPILLLFLGRKKKSHKNVYTKDNRIVSRSIIKNLFF